MGIKVDITVTGLSKFIEKKLSKHISKPSKILMINARRS